ncbi:hypothetical protein AAE478_003779 [Parahypoxylon ruwenzoriense]
MAAPTPPKSMSSRLLTMKFMQRAAASSSPSASAQKPEEQVSKRRKLNRKTAARGNTDHLVQIDQSAVQAALAEEERKRQEALEKHATELGDARWVLDIPSKGPGSDREIQTPLNVVQVGFAQIDSSDAAGLDAESTDASYGRIPMVRRYNMNNKQATKYKAPKDDNSDSDDPRLDPDYHAPLLDEEPGYSRRPRTRSGSGLPPLTASQSKKSAERARATEFAEKRRKKEVKLNDSRAASSSGGLLSISSGGGTTVRQPMNFTCHRCGRPGHKVADCKNPPQRTER